MKLLSNLDGHEEILGGLRSFPPFLLLFSPPFLLPCFPPTSSPLQPLIYNRVVRHQVGSDLRCFKWKWEMIVDIGPRDWFEAIGISAGRWRGDAAKQKSNKETKRPYRKKKTAATSLIELTGWYLRGVWGLRRCEKCEGSRPAIPGRDSITGKTLERNLDIGI